MSNVDRKGNVWLAREKFKPLESLFIDKIHYKDGRTALRRFYPQQTQWLYVKYLFAGYTRLESYKKAGYKNKGKSTAQDVFLINAVHNSKTVQVLINAVIGDYLKRRKVSAQKILDEALKVYDRCETVREQLDTLKFINNLLPKGYARQCKLSNCPLRKWKK